MREDMPYLLVGRERVRSSERNPDVRMDRHRGRRGSLEDLEALPKRQGMRPGKIKHYSERKELNENLSPFARFLASKVGTLWDKVYSEIRSELDLSNPIELHIMEHLWQFVHRHVEVDGDKVYSALHRRYSLGKRELWDDGRTFYVHPETRILMRPESRRLPWNRRVKSVNPDKREINGVSYEKIEGIWYHFKDMVYRYEPLYQEKVLTPVKKQLSGKELRALGLKNDP